MPRKPRIEYEDAIYHVMNRGNYRDDIFLVKNSGAVFEKTLFETCGRFGWVLQAYIAMSNHYHLALQTPDTNLAKGMQWFQSTFGNRFNRLINQHGHIFQDRYKALLIESNQWLSDHLNMGSIYTISRVVAHENRRSKGRSKLWRKLLTAKR